MSRNTKLSILLIVIGACICYANSVRNTFVYDDYMVLVNNHYIRNIDNLPRLFTADYFRVSAERTFRPFGTIALFFQYAVFGYNPAGYHAINLLTHIANAILLLALLRLLACSRRSSFIAALCFALHPAISETVFCVSYLEDLWGLFFYLFSLIGFVRFRQRGKPLDAVLMHACFFLSLLAKEMGVTLLIVMPMISILWYGEKPRATRGMLYCIIPACIILCIYIYMRFFWLYLPEKQALYPGGSLFITLVNIPRVFWYYVKLCFLPVGLTADYEFPVHSGFAVSLVVSFILSVIAVFAVKKSPARARFFILWFVVNFLPVSNIIPFGAVFAERYLYFPIAGFAGLAGMFIDHVYADKRITAQRAFYGRALAPVFVIIAVVSYCVLLMVRAPAWHSDETLWFATVKYSPRQFTRKATLYVNLGNVYYRNNDLDNALKAYKYALKLDPSVPGIRNNMGVVYMEKGYMDMAKSEFLAAIAMRESFTDPYFSLAKLYMSRNQFQKAKDTIEKALVIAPQSVTAHRAMVVICDELGQFSEALTHCYKIIELDPLNGFAYYNATVLYLRTGRVDLAQQIAKEGLRRLPDNNDLRRSLEEIQKTAGQINR